MDSSFVAGSQKEDSRKKSDDYSSPRGTSEWMTRIHGEHHSAISAPVSTKIKTLQQSLITT